MAVTCTPGLRASLWVSAGVVGHTLWMGAAPSMTYPIYASEWHLTPTVTAAVFALSPLVGAVLLTRFRALSHYLWLRDAVVPGICAFLLGALPLTAEPDRYWV